MIRNRITFAVEVYEARAGVYERMGEFKRPRPTEKRPAGSAGMRAPDALLISLQFRLTSADSRANIVRKPAKLSIVGVVRIARTGKLRVWDLNPICI